MERKGKRKQMIDNNTDNPWWWILNKGVGASFLCISLFSLLVRVAISLHSYSGAGHPPKYGDFEAQRHWMEITINLPPKEWYRNSTLNDLSYWGLDYPPLTAYQSYIHGLFLKSFLPESVSLLTSRGHESYLGKLLMRWTVFSSDALVFFPAVFCFIFAYNNDRRRNHQSDIAWLIVMILLNPSLILVDHGHFQYNCISLGLTVGAVAAVFSNKELLACVLFSLALNHKQMSAYYAPAFFSHLLGKCLKRRHPFLEVLKLGLAVLATFAVVWWPFLPSKEACIQVLARLAPFERGLYEDYVANFWCTTSILIKWKKLFTIPSLKLLSFAATVLTCLPSMVQQIKSPSKLGFLYGLLNCSFSFYLFSFQVHEKSILLPLLPASLLAIEEPWVFQWLTHYGLLSMLPLLQRDNLIVPYFSLFVLFYLLYYAPGTEKSSGGASSPGWRSILSNILIICSLVLHGVYLTMQPPKRYPFIYEAMIMLLCFSQFVLLAFYSNSKQWMLLEHYNNSMDKKHL